MSEQLALQPVDAADITILVDNSVDVLLPSTEMVRRAPQTWDSLERSPLIAEHGNALLLTVHKDGRTASLLYDAGLGRDTLTHNMDVLGIQPTMIQAIVLSHGHRDHHGGLKGLFEHSAMPRVPLILHPDAWRDRKNVHPEGESHLPPLNRADLIGHVANVVEERRPSLWLDDTVLVTGQVDRLTDFEKGFATHYACIEDRWEADPWLWDDQAVVCHVKGKGLVVLSGCSHAGIVNILRYARRLTGIETVYAIIGGLHLSGKVFEAIIPRTVAEIAPLRPQVIVPGHCTGWKALHEIVRQLPDTYIHSSVGTRLHLA